MAAGMHGPGSPQPPPTYEQVRAESLAKDQYIAELTAINTDLTRQGRAHQRRQRAVMALMRYPELSGEERVGILGLLRYLYARASPQHLDASGVAWVDYSRDALIEQTGLSLSTLSRVLRSCVAYGWLQRRERPILGKNLYTITQPSILLPAPTLTDALELAATWTKPADAPQHGGKRLRCLDCGSDRVLTVHTCQECGSHNCGLADDVPRQPRTTSASVAAAAPVRPGGDAPDLRSRRRGWNPEGDPEAESGEGGSDGVG